MCDHYAESYWPYKETNWRDPAPVQAVPRNFAPDEPATREGLHFPPSDEFGYGS